MKQVKVENIGKSYDNHVVVNDFSATFEAGKVTAIIGESGSGKTTLLNLLGLIEKLDKGKIYYDSKDVSNLSKYKVMQYLRYEIAYLFQNYALIDNETVANNLKISLEYNKEKVNLETVLEKVNLPTSILSKKIFTLSGGEQQRVAMARVLMKPCSLVLCDEPTGNLDEHNKKEVFELLQSLANQGKIVIVVTHDKEIANMSDCVIDLMKYK